MASNGKGKGTRRRIYARDALLGPGVSDNPLAGPSRPGLHRGTGLQSTSDHFRPPTKAASKRDGANAKSKKRKSKAVGLADHSAEGADGVFDISGTGRPGMGIPLAVEPVDRDAVGASDLAALRSLNAASSSHKTGFSASSLRGASRSGGSVAR